MSKTALESDTFHQIIWTKIAIIAIISVDRLSNQWQAGETGQAVDTSLGLVSRNMVCIPPSSQDHQWLRKLACGAQQKGRNLSSGALQTDYDVVPRGKAVQVSMKLLSDGKVQRMTSKSHRHVQATLVKLSIEYDQAEKSPQQLLRACAHMYAPVESWLTAYV